MKITKDFLIRYGICQSGLGAAGTVGSYFPDVSNIIDSGYSHKKVYGYLRKFFIENMDNIDRNEWLEHGKWFQMLRENPQAIIDGGDAIVGEKYRATSFNFEALCDTLDEARASLDKKYGEIKADPIGVCKCFYWKNVINGKHTQDVNAIDELIDGVEYNVFNSESGTYETASSLSEVINMINQEQQRILSAMRAGSLIETSVRDTVDGYVCWVGEEQHAFTEDS